MVIAEDNYNNVELLILFYQLVLDDFFVCLCVSVWMLAFASVCVCRCRCACVGTWMNV